jgi:hypothetical protein
VNRWQASVAGIAVASAGALMLPIPPFSAGAWILLVIAASGMVWCIGYPLSELLGAWSNVTAMRMGPARPMVLLAGGVVLGVASLAVVRGHARPVAEDYWAGLAPARVSSRGDPQFQFRRFNACKDTERCTYVVDDDTCLVVPAAFEVFCSMECRSVCPYSLEVRNDRRTGQSALSRKDAFEPNATPRSEGFVRNGNRQGPMLTSRAVGSQIRMPNEWLALAGGVVALVLAAGATVFVRKRSRAMRGSEPYRTATSTPAVEPSWREVLAWRSLAAAATVCTAPVIVAACLGVGV